MLEQKMCLPIYSSTSNRVYCQSNFARYHTERQRALFIKPLMTFYFSPLLTHSNTPRFSGNCVECNQIVFPLVCPRIYLTPPLCFFTVSVFFYHQHVKFWMEISKIGYQVPTTSHTIWLCTQYLAPIEQRNNPKIMNDNTFFALPL